MFTAIGV